MAAGTAVRTASTPSSTARFGKRSAATPPISTATTNPRLVAAATTDRSDGPPPDPMTCHTRATSHSPSASSEADPDAISSRYSRCRNGRSARGRRPTPPAPGSTALPLPVFTRPTPLDTAAPFVPGYDDGRRDPDSFAGISRAASPPYRRRTC